MKVSEKETSAVAVETMPNEGNMIEEALQLLLDQNAHQKMTMTEFVFHGPVEILYQLMHAKRPDGLPADAAALVSWFRVPANQRRLKAAQIFVSFPPLPRREGVVMVRLERGTPDSYQRRIDGVLV